MKLPMWKSVDELDIEATNDRLLSFDSTAKNLEEGDIENKRGTNGIFLIYSFLGIY